jgi:acetylornithine deacetylase
MPASDAALSALERLVAFPTVAGAPNRELVEWVAERLAAAGAQVSILGSPRPDGLNLHACFGPIDAPGGIVLSAHTDVVGVEGQPWSADPFALRVDGKRAIARGTADMKGFVAAVLAAADAERDRLPRLRAPVHVALSTDEELGCKGVGPLLEQIARVAAPLAGVVVGEPTALRVVDRHKGKAAVRAVFRGRSAHSSLATSGVNAVAYAARLAVALLGVQDELAAGATDPAYAVPYATVGVGPIAGGVAVNIVPDRCRLDVDVRVLPQDDPQALVARVGALADGLEREMRERAPECSVTLEPLSAYPGLAPGSGDDGGAFAARVAAAAGGEAADVAGAVDFGTEAGLFQRAFPGVPVLVCGPGDMAQGHTADEFIALDQLAGGEAFVRELLAGAAA